MTTTARGLTATQDIVEIDIVLAEMLARAATDPHHREADPMEGAL